MKEVFTFKSFVPSFQRKDIVSQVAYFNLILFGCPVTKISSKLDDVPITVKLAQTNTSKSKKFSHFTNLMTKNGPRVS